MEDFKDHLRVLVDSNKITTGAECETFLKSEAGEKKDTVTENGKKFNPISEAREKEDTPPKERKTFNAINVAFTGKGVLEVRINPITMYKVPFLTPDSWLQMVGEYTDRRLRDLLHDRGMYQDLVFEGPDEPERLNTEYKPPPNHPAGNGDWRNDGMFIVAAQRKEELDKTMDKLEKYFHIGEDNASIKFTVTKEGQVRNADGKAERRHIPDEKDETGTKTRIENLHGKEQ